LIEILDISLADNVSGRLLRPDGSYVQLSPSKHEQAHDTQVEFMARAKSK
jgi:polyphosphate kinase